MGGKMRENAAEREPGGAASWGGGEGTPGLKGSTATTLHSGIKMHSHALIWT